MALTRSTLLEGVALASCAGFWCLAATGESDDVAVCATFGCVVFMLWTFVRIVLTKSSPTYKQPTASPPSSDQILSVISSRRSIYPKDFNGKIISKEVIDQILEAGNWAPTHKLTQPWRFVVICSLAKFKLVDMTIELCRTLLPAGVAAKTVAKLEKKKETTGDKVSHYIAVCMQRCPKPDTIPEWEEMCAVAAAAQNMLLAASALGVAGYWTSWQAAARDSQEMKTFLGLSGEEDRCLGFLVLGYTDRGDQYRGSRGPVSEKTTWKL